MRRGGVFDLEIVERGSGHVVLHVRGDGAEEAFECGGVKVDCNASAEWPCLYHGVLDLPYGPLDRLGRGHEHNLGTLRFPCEAGTITRVFLVCGYDAQSSLCAGPT